MKLSWSRFIIKYLSLVLALLVLMGCSIVTQVVEPSVQPVTASPGITSTRSPSATQTRRPSSTPVPTYTKAPTKTEVPPPTARPSATPGFIISDSLYLHPAQGTAIAGTAIPRADVPITYANLTKINNIARWGRGSISRVAFSPAGDLFVVSSAYGLAVYDMKALNDPPRWTAFSEPIFADSLSFREDGQYVLLHEEKSWYINLQSGAVTTNNPGGQWVVDQESGGYKLEFFSDDRALKFSGRIDHKPFEETDEWPYTDKAYFGFVSAEVTDQETGTELFDLSHDTIYVEYEDYNSPDGCDLSSFSMCGNVYDPLPLAPFRGAFSTTKSTFALLLRPPDLYSSSSFSILKTYNARNGTLLNSFGSFDLPVVDFAYQPGKDTVLVAYTNGSIQLWDIFSSTLLHQSWNFTASTYGFDFTFNGSFALSQYPNLLEIRRTEDGAIVAQYEAVTYAVSPIDNRIAIGKENGEILVIDLNKIETVSRMVGHKDYIYDLAFSPDGQLLVSTSQDCSLRSWDANTGAFQHYFEKVEVNAYGEEWTQSRIFVYDMQFVPGTDQIVGFGSWGTAAGWNIHSGAAQYHVLSEPLEYYQGMLTLNPHFPESFWVMAEEERFYIDEIAYNLKTGEVIGPYQGQANQVGDCSAVGPVSADGEIMFTGGYGSLSSNICVLKAESKELLSILPGPSRMGGVYLSPDGTRLYVPTWDGTVWIYQVEP